MSIGRALIIAVSGFMVVFLMLCLLWFIIVMVNKVTSSLEKGRKTEAAPAAPAAVKAAEPAKAAEPQEAVFGGEIALYDVDEKTAACIMAIISDETKIPLSQLIFKSIRALN
ncbi:MAG: OadG family protein [Solobacterium sp.]|nr:OadG family protein [Solobacterium sp.]